MLKCSCSEHLVRSQILTGFLPHRALIKRALAAAKELDDDDQTTENEGEDDDDDKDTTIADGEDSKQDLEDSEEEEDVDDKEESAKSQEDAEGEPEGEEEKDESSATVEKAEKSKEGGEEETGEEKKDAPATPKKVATKKVVKAKTSPASVKSDDGGEKKKKDTRITTKYRNSSYIKLSCCHCGTKCIHFKEYQNHLFRGLHKAAMRRLAGKTRDKLMEMRQTQRVAQKEEDEKVDENSEQKSSYCPLCQLNFRQPKAVHQKSDGHKEMKRFLMPYCATCKIGFKSPMAYEAHRCSLEHLKFKARVERYAAAAKEDEDAGTEIDLENFTTVDEVGNVDEPIDTGKDSASTPKKAGSSGSNGRPGTDDEEDESDDVDDDTVIIGSEHVKKVEVQYCDLCNMYLPRRDDPEKMLRAHCKNRAHLRLYIRQREDKKLRMRAERIHKKKLTDAKAKKDAKKGDKDASVASEADSSEKTDAAKSDKKADGEETEKEKENEEQMWEVVDNDLGDLLREVSGPTEDAEEEEDEEKTSSERYDKFKHTEKNGVEQSSSTHEDDDVVEVPVGSPEKKGAATTATKKATNGDANGGDAEKEVKADA